MSISPISLGPKAYAVRSLAAFAAFAALTLGFSLIIYALLAATRCANDVCGAVGIIGSSILRPLICLVTLGYFFIISTRRARDAGLPAACGAFVPLMMIADANDALHFKAGWAYAFSQGVLRLTFPTYLIFSLACVGLLCMVPHGALRLNRGSWASRALIALAAFLVALALFRTALEFLPPSAVFSLPRPMLIVVARASGSYAFIPMLVFLFGTGALVYAQRNQPSGGSANATQTAFPPASHFPLGWSPKAAIAVALALATALTLFHLVSNDFNIVWAVLLLPAWLATILPTTLMYLPVICALFNLRIRRNAAAWGLLFASLLPSGFWITAIHADHTARQAEIARIATIPTVPLERVPSTIVVEGDFLDCPRLQRAFPAVTEVVHVAQGGGESVIGLPNQWEIRATSCAASGHQSLPKWSKLNALPDEYLLVVHGKNVTFAVPSRASFMIGGEPIELRHVAPGRVDRLSASYEVVHFTPAFPPLLSSQGWFPARSANTIEDVRRRRTDFVIAGLQGSTSHGQ